MHQVQGIISGPHHKLVAIDCYSNGNEYFPFYNIFFFFPLSLTRLLPGLNCLPFTSTRVHPLFFSAEFMLLIFSVFCVVLFVFVMCLVFDVSRASGLSILHCLLQFSLTLIADDYKKIKIVAMHDLYLGQQ